MYSYKIIEKAQGFRFLIFFNKKKIVFKSAYYADYTDCVFSARSELDNWSK